MHIGLITSEYPHPKVKHAAGIGTSIKNLGVALVKNDIKVSIFVYHQDINAIVDDNGVKIHLIKSKKYLLGGGWLFYRKYLERYLKKVIKSEKIDLLEAPDWTGITAFMKFKVPMIIRFHGSDAYFCMLDKRKQKFKNALFEKSALKGAAAFIAPTSYAGDETQKLFNLNPEKIKTIHYGLKLDRFVNESPQEYNDNTILYFGTIIRKKGVLELASVFNKVIESNPKAQLILIGSDSIDIKTKSKSTYKLVENILSDSARANTKYLGRIPYKDINTHIKKAHVCVFPSFAETFGLVTIESMALQKPVVNTNIGWANELIDHGVNGYLVHPSDIDGYASKIVDLLNDKELSRTIGNAARIKVEEKFDINKRAQENIAYYKSVLASWS